MTTEISVKKMNFSFSKRNHSLGSVMVLLFAFLQILSAGEKSLFSQTLSRDQLIGWVKIAEFGGLAGIPDVLIEDKSFNVDWEIASLLATHPKYLNVEAIFTQISEGLKNQNFAPLFGWYLSLMNSDLRVEMSTRLIGQFTADDTILTSACAYMVKNLFEQEVMMNGRNDKALVELLKLIKLKKVDIKKYAIFDGDIESSLRASNNE